MIFEVDSSQIERLNADQIVELLRRLVHAELLKHDIPLRSGSVPAQINIADGGEDGRVEWSGGPNQTDWLPSRYSVFQSKRGKTTPAGLKKETWTKASQKAGEERVLNEALAQAVQNNGAYIVITATAVVGTKRNDRIKEIRAGILEAGHDPIWNTYSAHGPNCRIQSASKSRQNSASKCTAKPSEQARHHRPCFGGCVPARSAV